MAIFFKNNRTCEYKRKFEKKKFNSSNAKSSFTSPDRGGSVGWALSHRGKGRQWIPGQGTCLGCAWS